MADPQQPAMSLTEWLVLCLVCERPTHGFAVARLLAQDGSMGHVWRVPKPVIYRSLQRLEQLGLVEPAGTEPTSQGPVRSVVAATPAGRADTAAWLARPVVHARDVRSELLVKLALLDRAGESAAPLLTAQREQLLPIAAALRDWLAEADGFERTLALWRYETVSATLRFLDAAMPARVG
jgi:DNA-binding PadR family transcriptional regulator